MKRAPTPTEINALLFGLSDADSTDLKIEMCHAGWLESRNPFFVWLAIDICITAKPEFPGWILDYLKKCAVQMRAPAVRDDLRKRLRSILDFPSGKRGPGNPLDPDLGRPELCFVLQFSAYVCCGVDPATALTEACNDDVFDDENVDINEINNSTMQAWIKRHYGLKAWPRTLDEWQEIILRQYPREQLEKLWVGAARLFEIDPDKNPFIKAKTIISRNSRLAD